jgi:hypothetical protein
MSSASSARSRRRSRFATSSRCTSAKVGSPTVKQYAEGWIKDRRTLGLRTADEDDTRLNLHALPTIGEMAIDEVRPRHIRDLVLYGVLATMFRTEGQVIQADFATEFSTRQEVRVNVGERVRPQRDSNWPTGTRENIRRGAALRSFVSDVGRLRFRGGMRASVVFRRVPTVVARGRQRLDKGPSPLGPIARLAQQVPHADRALRAKIESGRRCRRRPWCVLATGLDFGAHSKGGLCRSSRRNRSGSRR